MTSLVTRARGWVALVCLIAACGTDAGGPTCGAGTVAEAGACVPAGDTLGCGPGTTLVNGSCIVDEAGPDATTGDDASTDAPEPDDVVAPPDSQDETSPCIPSCLGLECGSDGCGGTCGSCDSKEKPFCSALLGVCVATCVPDCLGKSCGDDGCGGTCGECDEGASCQWGGRCVADAWTCDANWYGAFDACDCACGAPDPDCADPSLYVAGCDSFEVCDASGSCVSPAPQEWTCPLHAYAAFDACDCECGAVDPDCVHESLPVQGCGIHDSCSASGECVSCVPACDGKECGPDGCGGDCGTCAETELCSEGTCADACAPVPLLCAIHECGDDGCGGSCGDCPAGTECESGFCQNIEVPVSDTSCVGRCGTKAPSGCFCVEACEAAGTCCDDYEAACSCVPQCDGKTCGDDGCGGDCGTCGPAAPYCGDDGVCSATCTPECTGKSCGDDGCGGNCGVCGPGTSCAWTFACVPDEWMCPMVYYDDGAACDCGCGTGDPDCDDAANLVFGCGFGSVACLPTGTCDADFCSSNASCSNAWCTGVFASGPGTFDGVCAVPDASAKPPGVPCEVDAECSTDACIAGSCRLWCDADGDCPEPQRCLGVGVEDPFGGGVLGYASVCDAVGGSAAPCDSQADCAPAGEVCHPYLHPKTFAPVYFCTPLSVAPGQPCPSGTCPDGLSCVSGPDGAVCVVACPAGAEDCGAQASCSPIPFSDHGTTTPADDTKVPVCIPN